MKTFIFIFTFALIACLMLAQGAPVDEATDGPLANDVPIADNVPQADNFLQANDVVQANDKLPQAAEDLSEAAVLPPVKAIDNSPSVLGNPSKQCMGIGSLCALSDDCCSLRCSSYNARCSS